MTPKYELYFGRQDYPVDAVMPAGAQSMAEIILGALTIGAMLWGMRNIAVRKDARLLILMLAGLIAVMMEAHAMIIWRFFYPPVDQNNLYVGLGGGGQPVPVFLAFVYSLYFGLTTWTYLALTDGKWSGSTFFLTIIFITVFESIMEICFIYLGLWGYYDDQPFTIFGFPVHVAFTSACMCILYAEIQRIWFSCVTGARQFVMVMFGPMLLIGILTAYVYPVYVALESHRGLAATRIGSLMSMGISLLASFVAVRALARVAK